MATQTRDLADRLSDIPEVDLLLQHMPVGVVVASAPDGRILFINERARDLFPDGLANLYTVDDYAQLVGYRPNGRQYAADEWPMARALHGEVVMDEPIEVVIGTTRRILLVSASPIRDAAGEVARGIVLYNDVTEQRQEERRREFLMELSDELRMLDDAGSLLETAAIATGEHLGVSSIVYADVDEAGDNAEVRMEYRNGRLITAGKYFLEDFGQPLVDRLRRGSTVSVEDVLEEPEAAHEVFEGWNYRSFVAVPIVRHGRLIALFTVLHSVPRQWMRSDLSLLENVAERTWHAVEKTRAQGELSRSRDWLSLALRAGSTALWEWDLRSGQICWSEEHEALFGATQAPRVLTFGRWLALVHQDDRARARQAARQIATMREGEIEFEYRVAGAAERWITMRGRVLADTRGLPHRVVGVAVDTSERKSAELEREELLRETREASDAKSHFISVISHEFRTPLTAIIGYTELLSTGVSGTLAPAQGRQLERIRASAWHLTQMVDEILTFSRLEAGHESLNEDACDVVSLTRDAAAMVAPGAHAKDVGLACELPEEPVVLRTDTGKLRQVLLNLLSNAVKFTDRGGITVRVRALDETVEFTVADSGIGIPAEHIDRIWERFWQADQHTSGRSISGAGLGLTISRRLVELMGGTMSVHSMPGEGSRFSFCLPLRGRQKEKEQEQVQAQE